VFIGWQENLENESHGFFDQEIISNTVESGEWVEESAGIVLNEILPNPNGEEYGFDFGQDQDDMPQGEWVELYNNDGEDYDLDGWYIRDSLDSDSHKIIITSLNTDLATTTIFAHGFLVVYINKAIFNNTGDTARLFDENDNLIDTYSYTTNDYCDLEPTPGEENADDPSGSCAGVPGNKSYARIPDGIGEWVDPYPTPGMENRQNVEDQAGAEDEDAVVNRIAEEMNKESGSPAENFVEIAEEMNKESESPAENFVEIAEEVNEESVSFAEDPV
ncbi:MAG: lamin tail domain-containing protein, partial [Candidatus Kuenenbacteria bacterium]